MNLVLTGRPLAPTHFSTKTDVGDRDRLCVDCGSSFQTLTRSNQVVGRNSTSFNCFTIVTIGKSKGYPSSLLI